MEQAIGAGVGLIVFLAISAGAGLLTGALARLVLPGPDPMSWLATLGFGMAGSLAGALLARLVRMPPPLDFAIAVAVATLLIWYFRRRRAANRPAPGSAGS